MPGTKTVRLEDLGPALQRLVDRAVPMLYTELRDEVASRVFVKLVEISPVGNTLRNRRAGGKYRASHVPSAGEIQTRVLPDMPSYLIPGEEVIDAVVRRAAPQQSIFIANAAAAEKTPDRSYAGLLEGGRRQYSRVGSRKVVWVGSEYASEGIYGPARRAILAMRATIEGSAIRKVKGRL